MSIETVLRFAQLGLSAPILQAIDEIGYETPSPIQARSIPTMLAGRDLLGQAQTGTGKTAAFALPILCRVDPGRRTTQAIVLTPTRELAIQVAEAIHAYGRHLDGLHVLPIYGGQHIGAQLRPLQRGVHVVVGTPGRIIDHLERGTLSLDAIETVVLDEADEMLRMGFIDDVNCILEKTPENKQVALFSATLPAEVRRIADRHLDNPEVITIETATTTVESVQQRYLIAPWRQKLDAMTRILETTDFNAMLIFVRTKVATLEVSEKLQARGHASAALNGDMQQSLRHVPVPAPDAYFATGARQLLSNRDLTLKLLAMQLLAEGAATAIFRTLAKADVEPVLSELLPLIEKDEARHVGLGVMHLPKRLAAMNLRQLKKVRRMALSVGNLMGAANIRNADAYRTLGIDPRELNRSIDRVVFELIQKLGVIPGTDDGFIPVVEPEGDTYDRIQATLLPEPGETPRFAVRMLHRAIDATARLLPS